MPIPFNPIPPTEKPDGSRFCDPIWQRWLTSISTALKSLSNQVSSAPLTVPDYASVRAISSDKTSAYVTGYLGSATPSGIAGLFVRDDSDTSTSDNNGTVLVDALGRRWKRAIPDSVSPAWFGAAADSVTDDTSALQAAINFCGSQYSLELRGTYLCSALTSSSSVHWFSREQAKLLMKPGTYTGPHVSLSGNRVVLEGIDFDGNQWALTSSSQGGNGLSISGQSPTLRYVRCRNYNGTGYSCTSSNVGVAKAVHVGCNFDDNAGLGLLTQAASWLSFQSCTFSRNGYGYQKTRANPADTSHGFVAFGTALRLRTHHVEFLGCQATDNGRDGFNVNQGSYAIKFVACIAAQNDDGGFTIASDNTGTGLPGESEACYDLEYIDCESSNNYTSGLVAYQTVHNMTVVGGRYYNNHRLAGNQAVSSSYYNGVYIAAGSTGVKIKATVYDERQSCPITAISGGTLTATGWVAGNMNYYPKVAIYSGTDGSFKGYGKITSESSGSVTIITTTANSVTLASIAVGDFVTQAVQHNGVFFDNNCQGVVEITGARHRPGASGASGRMVYSGAFSGGQNIILPSDRLNPTELLLNPTFDASLANWTFALPGGGTATYYTGSTVRSPGALQLVGGTSAATGDGAVVSGELSYLNGEFIEVGVWCYASGRGDGNLQLFWQLSGTYYSTAVLHPGGGWKFLRIGAFMPSGVASVFMRLQANAGKTVYFDSAIFRAIDCFDDPREYSFPSRNLPY